MSECRVFWEPHRKRWKTNSSHWAELRDGLRKRVLSALWQRLLFPLFLLCPHPPFPSKKGCHWQTNSRADCRIANFKFWSAHCCRPEWRVIFFYLSALTPIQINFHSGKSRLSLFPFGTLVEETKVTLQYAGCLSFFLPPSHRGWLHRGTQGYQLIFPQTDSVAPVWRLTTQSLKVALKPVLTISDPVFFFFSLTVGFQSLGN